MKFSHSNTFAGLIVAAGLFALPLIGTSANAETSTADAIMSSDVHAANSLAIDPTVLIEQTVTASDGQQNDGFGWSVAISGDTALVGRYGDGANGATNTGSVYVFTYTNGTWVQTQKIIPSNSTLGTLFGKSIALDGATALISAPFAGLVYVFEKSNGTWSQTQILTVASGSIAGNFGWSVALDGNIAIIGEPFADVGGNADQGAAYVFETSGGTWAQTKKLTANDGAPADGFGSAVALSGSVAIVGAPQALISGKQSAGTAYIFAESGSTWSQGQKIAVGGGNSTHFGRSMALDGTTAFIGSAANLVYVYNKSGGVWTQSQQLGPSDAVPSAHFGFSIALSDGFAVIGADAITGVSDAHSGAAYLFRKDNGVWGEARKLTEKKGAANDGFGYSVAMDGSTILVGIGNSTVGGNTNQGRAYFYGGSNLSLAVSVPAYVDSGGSYASQSFVTNNASIDSPAVSVSIAVPPAASFLSATATQGSCKNTLNAVTCDFGQISGNAGVASATVKLRAPEKKGVMVNNVANVVRAIPAITASDAIRVGNNAPVASDGTLTTNENASASDTLEATDADDDPLTFSIVGQPGHGSVTLDDSGTGAYTYTPDQDYFGSDSFTFKANDGRADSNTATISITVNALPPVASDGTLTTEENTPASGVLVANDADDDPLTFSLVSQPGHGSVTLDDASTGAYTYTPDQDYSGNDSFTFKANDGQLDSNTATISITVNAAPPPPPPSGGGGITGPLGLAFLALAGLLVCLRRKR